MHEKENREKINKEVSDWLEQQYILWINKEGKRKTLGDFANYLQVVQPLLSRWMNGKALPGNENVIKLANFLSDEIYDILGWMHPISRSNQELKESVQTTDKPSLQKLGPREKQAPKRKRTVQQSTSTFLREFGMEDQNFIV